MTAAPKAAINASPLIFLGKLGKLHLLPVPVATTPLVLAEIHAGNPADHPEVDLINLLVEEGQLLVREARGQLPSRPTGLHDREASVLALALQEELDDVILDDRVGIRTAKALGLTPVSTPFLLLRACRAGELGVQAFARALDQLLDHRYHLSPRLYQALVQAAQRG